jgi:mannose-1-phosphate guanylyltransferase
LITGAPIPKQYCRILGPHSLLETTLLRIDPIVAAKRTLAVVNRNHLALALPQLASLDPCNIVVQPRNLDTGPGVLLSMLEIACRDPGATVAMFPSDHYVRNAEGFRRSIERMRRVVAAFPEKVALLGVRPEYADPGCGYIVPGGALTTGTDSFAVRAFHEKPDADTAADLIRHGALWNSFVMVARVRRVLELVRAVRPRDVALLEEVQTNVTDLATAYDRLGPWNFSRGFLARAPEHLIVTVAAALGWNDWGTPEAVERSFADMGIVPPWRFPWEPGARAPVFQATIARR